MAVCMLHQRHGIILEKHLKNIAMMSKIKPLTAVYSIWFTGSMILLTPLLKWIPLSLKTLDKITNVLPWAFKTQFSARIFFIYNKYKTPPLLFLFPPLSTLRVLINSYPDRFEILHDSIGFSGKILPGGELLDDDILQTISYSQTGRIVPHLLTQLSSMQELAQNSNLALQKQCF